MRPHIFWRSLRRQPIRTLLLLLLAAGVAFAFVALTACGKAPSADGTPTTDGTSSAGPAQAEQAAGVGVSTVGMVADADDLATLADGEATDPDADATASDDPNTIIIGEHEMLSGGFRYPGWGYLSQAGEGDWDVWLLTTGYAVMESDQHGAYQWSATAVKEHSLTENADGTATLTVEIAHDLTYSDGTPITVKDYLARLLVFSSPVAVEAKAPGLAGQRLAGFDAFRAYTGDNDGADVDGVTASRIFSGVRMLDDYTYELTISSDYYPDYYAAARACLQPDPPALWLGEGADICDDGEGCYLSDGFYEKSGDSFAAARTIEKNSYDRTKFPFSGPYTVAAWDIDAQEATLRRNPAYKGNFEGQKPSIETVKYVFLDDNENMGEPKKEMILKRLESGGLDVLRVWSGLQRIQAALALVDDEHLTADFYQRPGCGKLDFACDLGPAMFTEVRQALAYLLDRETLRQTCWGEYSVGLNAPYSPDFAAWRAVGDDIALNDYAYSPETAVKLLEDGGWVYNSLGQPYVAGGEGVDAVRYKKLTQAEADALDGANKTYVSVANFDGVEYRTVEIDGEYYMPLVLNWIFDGTPIADYITLSLAYGPEVAAAGMVIRCTTSYYQEMDAILRRDTERKWTDMYNNRVTVQLYNGVPTYNLFSMAEDWSNPLYDYSYCWSTDPAYAVYSANRLQDPYDLAFPYDPDGEKLTFDAAMEASGGQLGLDYLSMAMIENAKAEEEYDRWWKGYIERWNQLLPSIPLYDGMCYYIYNTKLENFVLTPFFGQARAVLYANVKGYEGA